MVGLAWARLDCRLHGSGLTPCCERLHQSLHCRHIDPGHLHSPKLAAVFQHVGAGCLAALLVVLLSARRERLELGGSMEALIQEGQSAPFDLTPCTFHNRMEFREARMLVCNRPLSWSASFGVCLNDVPAAILPIDTLRQGLLVDMCGHSWVELPFSTASHQMSSMAFSWLTAGSVMPSAALTASIVVQIRPLRS